MNQQGNVGLVRRFFAEAWGDPANKVSPELIHPDYWSSESLLASLEMTPDGRLTARITGMEALTREVAGYRDFYPDFTMSIKELFEIGSSSRAPGIPNWQVDRLIGAVVAVSWTAGATHPTATFTSRGGQLVPVPVSSDGVSIVRIVDGQIFSANKYWECDSNIFAEMAAEVD